MRRICWIGKRLYVDLVRHMLLRIGPRALFDLATSHVLASIYGDGNSRTK